MLREDRCVLLHAGGTPGPHSRTLRKGARRLGLWTACRRASAGTPAAGPRAAGALHRRRDRARACFGRAGIKDCVNGPIPHTPDGTRSSGRPMASPTSGWRRASPSASPPRAAPAGSSRLDRRRRALHRHAGVRPPPLRRLRQQELHQDQERGGLLALLRDPLPGRRAPGGASGEDQPPATSGSRPTARSGASAMAGSGPTGSRRRASSPATSGASAAPNYFEPVGAECRAVRERAGLIDITSFSKFRVSAPGRRPRSTACSPTGCRRPQAASSSPTR